MTLAHLTSPDAVLQAVHLCDDLGQDQFLHDHGFGPARGYWLEVDSKHYDSKAIAGVAHGIQHPNLGDLTPDQFSGGAAGAAHRLEQLGFTIVTAAQLNPPRLGDQYQNRTEISHKYGGNNVAGIIRFPGDTVVNAFSDEDGPYADEAPHPLQPFEYRGDGRSGHQRLVRGNKLLDEARQSRQAVRFWYRPHNESFTFQMWVAVLDRAQAWAPDDSGELRLEYTFLVMSVPDPDPETWPAQAVNRLDDAPITDTPPPAPLGNESAPTTAIRIKSYRQYIDALAAYPSEPSAPGKAMRKNYRRSRAARDAVLLRAGDQCEHDGCTGMPPDVTLRGRAILEVDHVDDLALGGPDHPRHMIALCPNCHAAKTRGSKRGQLTRHLRELAAGLHNQAIAAPSERTSF